MTLDPKTRDAIRRLGNDEDFQVFLTHLAKLRDSRLVELEDATVALQVHKSQGYCQALRDIADMCRK
jgi:2-polyprenyl-6-methoxyphenol hydroxylase-like FAD-dependent oxidoreductase